MPTIDNIKAYEILDSRGNPTIQVDVALASGNVGSASVPSGGSVGSHEAIELRDKDSNRYGGKGVLKSLKIINHDIFRTIQGMDAREQKKIDSAMIELDGSADKSKLGANSILAVSLAIARASSNYMNLPLFKSLVSEKINKTKCITYFHENQISYPKSKYDSDTKLNRDLHYSFINYKPK